MTSIPSLAEELRRHVYHLADEIGERNIFRRESLTAAEEYITETWQAPGFEVRRQVYQVEGVPSTILEVTLPGSNNHERWILEIYQLTVRSNSNSGTSSASSCLLGSV